MRTIEVGSAVKVMDEVGVEHDGLVTANWGTKEYDESQTVHLAINVVFVSADENKTDCYGRQTEHLSSLSHKSALGGCPGRYWYQP